VITNLAGFWQGNIVSCLAVRQHDAVVEGPGIAHRVDLAYQGRCARGAEGDDVDVAGRLGVLVVWRAAHRQNFSCTKEREKLRKSSATVTWPYVFTGPRSFRTDALMAVSAPDDVLKYWFIQTHQTAC